MKRVFDHQNIKRIKKTFQRLTTIHMEFRSTAVLIISENYRQIFHSNTVKRIQVFFCFDVLGERKMIYLFIGRPLRKTKAELKKLSSHLTSKDISSIEEFWLNQSSIVWFYTYGCKTTTDGRQMAQPCSVTHCAFFRHCPLFSRDSAHVNTKMGIQYLISRYLRNVLEIVLQIRYTVQKHYLWLPPWKPRDPDAWGRGS